MKIKAVRNDRGFTLVELIAVVAIVGVLAVSSALSLNAVFSMRAKRAAKTVDALLSQCRIDNLSGIDSTLCIRYDAAEDTCTAELARTDEGTQTVYKTEPLGERISVTFTVNGTAVTAADGIMPSVTFSMETGAVTSFAGAADGWSQAQIAVSGAKTYTITLFRLTGEHSLS